MTDPNTVAPAPAVLLEVSNLTKLYRVRGGWFWQSDFVSAINDVSLFVNAGETLGVVGETGSGKTTLGLCVLRLLDVDFGQIVFEGEDISDLGERQLGPLRGRMQPVFQDPNSSLNPDLTVERIIGEGLLLNAPGARADWRQHSAHWLAQVGLSQDLASRRARELSAGEKQRVAIARALSVSPRLLVCDEPVSALDVSARGQVINLLLDLQDRFGLGLLFISHDLQLVRYISHRILVMYAGRVVETAPAAELHARARHPYTRALLHASRSIRARHSLRVLEGEMVDPGRLPSGCAFHPRCPRAEPGRCDKEQPPLLASDDDPQHLIACHFPCS